MAERKILDPVVKSEKHAEIKRAVFKLKNDEKAIDATARQIVKELTNGFGDRK
jgi:hypothetical protein